MIKMVSTCVRQILPRALQGFFFDFLDVHYDMNKILEENNEVNIFFSTFFSLAYLFSKKNSLINGSWIQLILALSSIQGIIIASQLVIFFFFTRKG